MKKQTDSWFVSRLCVYIVDIRTKANTTNRTLFVALKCVPISRKDTVTSISSLYPANSTNVSAYVSPNFESRNLTLNTHLWVTLVFCAFLFFEILKAPGWIPIFLLFLKKVWLENKFCALSASIRAYPLTRITPKFISGSQMTYQSVHFFCNSVKALIFFHFQLIFVCISGIFRELKKELNPRTISAFKKYEAFWYSCIKCYL